MRGPGAVRCPGPASSMPGSRPRPPAIGTAALHPNGRLRPGAVRHGLRLHDIVATLRSGWGQPMRRSRGRRDRRSTPVAMVASWCGGRSSASRSEARLQGTGLATQAFALQCFQRRSGISFSIALTTAAALPAARPRNISIWFVPSPPPARSARLRTARNGTSLA